MNGQGRAAAATGEEGKRAHGVFAVVCRATGEVWIGWSRQVDTEQDGLWAALRRGTSSHASLLTAWREYGEREFRFEELERLRDDFPEIGRAEELRRRQALWRARLHAETLPEPG